MSGETVTVHNTTKNAVLGDRIRVAETSLSRIVGLLGQKGLEPGTGLIIFPSQAIHTVAMRFAIDVIFLDRNWRVVRMRPAMVPYRLTGSLEGALRLGAAGRCDSENLNQVGDQLAVD